MEEVDFVFKNSKRPRLQHFDIKKQKLGKEQASSVVSFRRSETLLKILEEPLSTKVENHNHPQIVRGKEKRYWGDKVVSPPPLKRGA